ncbi:MAG: nucleoside monophosphate kinase [Clostridiales bacterium]|nr:nucleoside monophosphate kinase [Clostridiales bacterium]
MNIVLLGIQGCGKGTLVSGLEKHLDLYLISMGQLLRDEVATGSELGKHIKEVQDRGELVDSKIVKDVLSKTLKTTTKPYTIFDGYPRNSQQADELDSIANVDLVIYLNLSKQDAIDRVMNRLNCTNCGLITSKTMVDSDTCPSCGEKLVQRSDDTIEGVTKRFELYEKETYPLIERYRSRGVLVEIDANNTPDERLNQVLKVINDYDKK